MGIAPSRHRPESEPLGRLILRRGLMAGFALSLGLLLIRAFSVPDRPNPSEAKLHLGIEAFEAGDLEGAKDHFLQATRTEDPDQAAAAYHNLALIHLLQSHAAPGASARESAREAVRWAEASLAIAPGWSGTAKNLELALRRIDSLEDGSSSAPEEILAQQDSASAADTRSGSMHRREGGNGQQPGDPEGISQEAARRVLASFRLMERESTQDALRSLLRDGTGVRPPQRRGPPW